MSFKRLLAYPLFLTAGATLVCVAVSLVTTRIAMIAAGYQTGILPYALAGGLPALVTPAMLYPLLRINEKLRRLRSQFERLAASDELTGLPNRRAFFSDAARMLSNGTGRASTIAALMVDVDHFKSVNDIHGHDVGDAVLRAVAHAIRTAASETGGDDWTVARLGGEEFVVLVAGLVPSAVARLAEHICRGARELRLDGDGFPTTVSIGVALRTGQTDIDSLLKTADDAVYLAKRSGRDRWGFAGTAAEAHDRRAPTQPAQLTPARSDAATARPS